MEIMTTHLDHDLPRPSRLPVVTTTAAKLCIILLASSYIHPPIVLVRARLTTRAEAGRIENLENENTTTEDDAAARATREKRTTGSASASSSAPARASSGGSPAATTSSLGFLQDQEPADPPPGRASSIPGQHCPDQPDKMIAFADLKSECRMWPGRQNAAQTGWYDGWDTTRPEFGYTPRKSTCGNDALGFYLLADEDGDGEVDQNGGAFWWTRVPSSAAEWQARRDFVARKLRTHSPGREDWIDEFDLAKRENPLACGPRAFITSCREVNPEAGDYGTCVAPEQERKLSPEWQYWKGGNGNFEVGFAKIKERCRQRDSGYDWTTGNALHTEEYGRVKYSVYCIAKNGAEYPVPSDELKWIDKFYTNGHSAESGLRAFYPSEDMGGEKYANSMVVWAGPDGARFFPLDCIAKETPGYQGHSILHKATERDHPWRAGDYALLPMRHQKQLLWEEKRVFETQLRERTSSRLLMFFQDKEPQALSHAAADRRKRELIRAKLPAHAVRAVARQNMKLREQGDHGVDLHLYGIFLTDQCHVQKTSVTDAVSEIEMFDAQWTDAAVSFEDGVFVCLHEDRLTDPVHCGEAVSAFPQTHKITNPATDFRTAAGQFLARGHDSPDCKCVQKLSLDPDEYNWESYVYDIDEDAAWCVSQQKAATVPEFVFTNGENADFDPQKTGSAKCVRRVGRKTEEEKEAARNERESNLLQERGEADYGCLVQKNVNFGGARVNEMDSGAAGASDTRTTSSSFAQSGRTSGKITATATTTDHLDFKTCLQTCGENEECGGVVYYNPFPEWYQRGKCTQRKTGAWGAEKQVLPGSFAVAMTPVCRSELSGKNVPSGSGAMNGQTDKKRNQPHAQRPPAGAVHGAADYIKSKDHHYQLEDSTKTEVLKDYELCLKLCDSRGDLCKGVAMNVRAEACFLLDHYCANAGVSAMVDRTLLDIAEQAINAEAGGGGDVGEPTPNDDRAAENGATQHAAATDRTSTTASVPTSASSRSSSSSTSFLAEEIKTKKAATSEKETTLQGAETEMPKNNMKKSKNTGAAVPNGSTTSSALADIDRQLERLFEEKRQLQQLENEKQSTSPASSLSGKAAAPTSPAYTPTAALGAEEQAGGTTSASTTTVERRSSQSDQLHDINGYPAHHGQQRELHQPFLMYPEQSGRSVAPSDSGGLMVGTKGRTRSSSPSHDPTSASAELIARLQQQGLGTPKKAWLLAMKTTDQTTNTTADHAQQAQLGLGTQMQTSAELYRKEELLSGNVVDGHSTHQAAAQTTTAFSFSPPPQQAFMRNWKDRSTSVKPLYIALIIGCLSLTMVGLTAFLIWFFACRDPESLDGAAVDDHSDLYGENEGYGLGFAYRKGEPSGGAIGGNKNFNAGSGNVGGTKEMNGNEAFRQSRVTYGAGGPRGPREQSTNNKGDRGRATSSYNKSPGGKNRKGDGGVLLSSPSSGNIKQGYSTSYVARSSKGEGEQQFVVDEEGAAAVFSGTTSETGFHEQENELDDTYFTEYGWNALAAAPALSANVPHGSQVDEEGVQ
ncbi:unnamed protein product [Amoebophrya sp. A120]|nr:unnamed protein product [Amoebophrya sp. A120]|eukprot:GSA120T00014119001.1